MATAHWAAWRGKIMKKKIFLALMLFISTMAFSESTDMTTKCIDSIYKTLIEKHLPIDAISFGVMGDIKSSTEGIIEKIIKENEYDGLFGNAVIVQSQVDYYYNSKERSTVFYLIYANIIPENKLKEHEKISIGETIGIPANKSLPNNGGQDVKIILYTMDSDSKYLMLKNGRPGVPISKNPELYIYPGMWLWQNNGKMDHLLYKDISETNLFENSKLLMGDAPYNYDISYTYRVVLPKFKSFKTIDESNEVKSFEETMSKTIVGISAYNFTRYTTIKQKKAEIILLINDNIFNYYNQEITGKTALIFLRSLGSKKIGDKSIPIFGIIDFQDKTIEEIMEGK